MTRWLALLPLLAFAACATPQADNIGQRVPDGIDALVIVLDDTRPQRRKQAASTPGYVSYRHYADDPVLLRTARDLTAKHGLKLVTQWPLKHIPIQCIVIEKPDETTLAALEADPIVKWVQPFRDFTTMTVSQPSSSWSVIPVVDKSPASGSGVTIAVVDTSVDRSHPALKESTLRQQNFAGRRGDFRGEAHGTAMVGLMAARPVPDSNVIGISQAADITLLRGCWQADKAGRGRCNTLTMALALDAAIGLNPHVLNLSITGPEDRVLDRLVRELTDRGTLVVAAYDDARDAAERFPTYQPGVVYAFGLSDAESRPRRSSAMVIGAPRHALSLAPASGYELVYGHSVAAAQVSGYAALLFSRSPSQSRSEVLKDLLKVTASP